MDGFIANLFELWGLAYLGNFSDEMYNNRFYNPIALLMIISSAIFILIYYYAVNHPRLNRWFWWLCTGLIVSVINFVIAWTISDNQLYNLYQSLQVDFPYNAITHYIPFSFIVALWSFVLFFIFSFAFKWWSRNCKYSPI